MLNLATKFAPVRAAMDVAHRAGLRCAEVWLDAEVLAGWQELAPLARYFPFTYTLHFPNRLNLGPETLEHTARLAEAIDARCLVIHQPMADQCGAALRRLCPGVALAVENQKYSPQEFAAWAERNAALTLDVEHFWKYTLRDAPLAELLEQVGGFLRRYGDKLRQVHLPGYLPGCKEHRPFYVAREMVFPVLNLLADFRFQGLIVNEADPEYQTPNDLLMAVLFFESWREAYDRRAPRGA